MVSGGENDGNATEEMPRFSDICVSHVVSERPALPFGGCENRKTAWGAFRTFLKEVNWRGAPPNR